MSLEELRRMAQSEQDRSMIDKGRYMALDYDLCQLCGAQGPDKRSLRIACFYAIEEVIPEIIVMTAVEGRSAPYLLRICKSCRGALLGRLEEWAKERRALRPIPKDSDGEIEPDNPEANIPVRIHGATKLVTREEWEAMRKGEPKGDAALLGFLADDV